MAGALPHSTGQRRSRATRFTAALLGGARMVAAADEKPVAEPAPSHVPEAAVRMPVTISPGSATRTLNGGLEKQSPIGQQKLKRQPFVD